jgi:nitrate/nitrite transport system substrate-binding protein
MHINPMPTTATPTVPSVPSRRSLFKTGGALAITASLPNWVHAAGSDAPEKKEIKIGFIPLTDCASIVMASVLGYDVKYGVKFVLSKEASWAGVRDKLATGELDMAHVLYGLVYGLQLGVNGPKKDMAVLMNLNVNGQAMTLSKKLADKGAIDGTSLAKLMRTEKREYTFAQTFPTGTHAMWLNYWLASHDINPTTEAKIITLPPPQMVANMRVGNMDGYCVGEPWNHRAVADGVGITAATSQSVWKDHPEKALGATAAFVKANPNTARAAIMAILEASRWIDASVANRVKMTETIAEKSYVNTSVDVIQARILGRYQNGLEGSKGRTWDDPNPMRFFNDGAVNYPYASDGMWFMTQHKRWGLLKAHPDYAAVAKAVSHTALYKEAASALKVSVPKSELRTSTLMDGKVWNGTNPAAYADSFKIKG